MRVRQSPRPPWKADEPCPCGSGTLFGFCCLGPKSLRVQLPRQLPPPPLTGYAHPKCYLGSTNDCSTKISGEHVISRNILEAMQGQIEFGGLPWLKPGETKILGLDGMVSNVLCTRHNSALSPLDTAAGKIFRSFRDVCLDLNPQRKSLSGKGKWFLVSGEALELWALKTLFGMFHGKLASRQGERLIGTHTLDVDRLVRALAAPGLVPPCGLYLRATHGGSIVGIDEKVSASPLANEEKNHVIGIRMGMLGFEFDVIMDPDGVDFDFLRQGAVFHPSRLAFKNRLREHIVVLTWPDTASESIIVEFSSYRGRIRGLASARMR